MIRVLMVIPQLGYGGAQGAFLRLATQLSKYADIKIALMARDYGTGPYTTAGSDTNLPVVLLDESYLTPKNLPKKVLRWWRMLRRLKEIKAEHDITISFLSGANLLNALAGNPHSTIVSERGSKLYHTDISPLRKFLWLRVLDPMTYRRAGKIVPASIGYAKEIAQIAGSSQLAKIVAIEGGIDTDSLLANADAPPDADIVRFCQGPTAVYSGRLDRGKGIDLLLSGFARLRAQQPNARLMLIGDGPLSKRIDETCQSLGLSVTTDGDPTAAVFMAGYRADPIRHFRLCQLFLFPSLHEGLGNALIEGVASGIPILAADCPWGPRSVMSGPDDIIDEQTFTTKPRLLANGTLMPMPDNPDALTLWTDEMRRILKDPAARRSRADCRQAVHRFDIEVTGLQWMDLIRDSAKRQHPR